MSLVIDANSNNGFPKQSNEAVGFVGYPDFQQILIKPSFPRTSGYYFFSLPGWKTPESGTVAKSVNGTVINFWSSDIISPICFQGSGSGGGFGDNGAFCGTGKMRIGLNYQFEAGKVIGKYIYFGIAYVQNYTNANYTATGTLRVGLLHSDGTLSQLPEISYSQTSPSPGMGSLGYYSQENANGLTTQAGDYVVVDINSTGFPQPSYSTASFGRQGGADLLIGSSSSDNSHPTPIQISIE